MYISALISNMRESASTFSGQQLICSIKFTTAVKPSVGWLDFNKSWREYEYGYKAKEEPMKMLVWIQIKRRIEEIYVDGLLINILV